MIKYKKPLPLEKLKEAGYNQTRILKERIISQSTVQRLRKEEPITFTNLSVICELLNCQPGDLIEYVPDEKKKKNEQR